MSAVTTLVLDAAPAGVPVHLGHLVLTAGLAAGASEGIVSTTGTTPPSP